MVILKIIFSLIALIIVLMTNAVPSFAQGSNLLHMGVVERGMSVVGIISILASGADLTKAVMNVIIITANNPRGFIYHMVSQAPTLLLILALGFIGGGIVRAIAKALRSSIKTSRTVQLIGFATAICVGTTMIETGWTHQNEQLIKEIPTIYGYIFLFIVGTLFLILPILVRLAFSFFRKDCPTILSVVVSFLLWFFTFGLLGLLAEGVGFYTYAPATLPSILIALIAYRIMHSNKSKVK